MLKNLTIEELDGGIEFIDIGASGGFPRSWQSFLAKINYYAFEPNKEECERLCAQPSSFNRVQYFPYAVADQPGEATLYKTQDMFCYSLLEPNQKLLDRYVFGEKFELLGTEPMQTVRLADVEELKGIDLDILKVDSQGLDRRILEHGNALLDQAFYVEVEPGFNETYKTEDTYAGLDTFLRERGFRLFEMTPHRVSRKNRFAGQGEQYGEMIWAESVWLKDYIALAEQGVQTTLSRGKALKILLICAIEGRLDFGYELAEWFAGQGLITHQELESLGDETAWQLADVEEDVSAEQGGFLTAMLRLLPSGLRDKLYRSAAAAVKQTHLFKT